MTIKAGWMLQVTSWENDGDFYNTKTLMGLSSEEAQFNITLCQVLQSIGQEEANESTYSSIAAKLGITKEDAVDIIQDKIYDLVGISGECSDYLRVCDFWKLYFIPFDIPEYQF